MARDDTETEFMLTQVKESNILKYMDWRKTRDAVRRNRSTGNGPVPRS